jgi:hypothetical protein
MNERYLTKSRYKLGLECPNKLFFTKKENEFLNLKTEDSFLMSLASGGFQVEELARLHYPEGILIEELDSYDYEVLSTNTSELLKKDQVVIFEAAFIYEGLFIRTDILVKKGNQIDLIEVKAKSYHPDNNYEFATKKGNIKSNWKPYLFDLAFQKYVVNKSNPNYEVTPYLMLADKSKTTTIDGLNQKFRITKNTNERTGIVKYIERLNNIDKESVLSTINVSHLISRIENGEDRIIESLNFEESINTLYDFYSQDKYFNYPIEVSNCKKCEFRVNKETTPHNLKSGFEYCWGKQLNWGEEFFTKPTLFDVWDFRSWQRIGNPNDIILEKISEDHLGGVKPEPGKISRTERQWIQIEKTISGDKTPFILKEELKEEMDSWKFPLNFIDFETSTVPLPFFVGQKPYEQVAFQFSHHIYHENGTIEHANEFISSEAGVYPNFLFARALMKSLTQNNGSVFKFATHENTIVNSIIDQLIQSEETDKDELIVFLKSISHSKRNTTQETWEGERDMIDLCEVIKHFYYNPHTNGSNSIKKVLPSVFESSEFIREKYSKPIGEINLGSKNFKESKIWLEEINNEIQDPYLSLGKIFKDYDSNFELLSEMEELSDGGAALTAYGKLQYTDMSLKERKSIIKSLLKYCELDTLAMVMIYEHLNEIVSCS